MNDRNIENLRELLERFWGPEKAQTYLDDIEKGEQILRENPAPEPDDMLLANIKAEIALNALPRRGIVFKRIAYRAMAVAAAIIIITVIGTNLVELPDMVETGPPVTASVFPWSDSEDMTTHDANLVYFSAQVDQIENELYLGAEGSDRDSENDLSEMENELIVIAGDFWKG